MARKRRQDWRPYPGKRKPPVFGKGPISIASLDEFTKAYLEAAIWSSVDPETGVPLENKHSMKDFAPQTLKKLVAEAREFQRENWDDIADALYSAGIDFWATRNEMGSGFWTGDWPAESERRLTDNALSYGEVILYIGDDGKIYSG